MKEKLLHLIDLLQAVVDTAKEIVAELAYGEYPIIPTAQCSTQQSVAFDLDPKYDHQTIPANNIYPVPCQRPGCGGMLVWRKGRDGKPPFLGCTNFKSKSPTCCSTKIDLSKDQTLQDKYRGLVHEYIVKKEQTEKNAKANNLLPPDA